MTKKFKARNPKHETRNKFKTIQTLQIPNESKSDSRFWIFRDLDLFNPGLFRISIFEFRILI